MKKSRSSRHARRGFTLVELLVVMAILALLASLVYGAMWHAANTAREARTKALIAKIHSQLMYRMESYQTRRLTLYIDPVSTPPDLAARIRLAGLRDMMRMELPQRFEDITNPPTDLGGGLTIQVPAVTYSYRNRLNAASPMPQYQGAECLYLIMTVGLGEEGLSAYEVSNSEVGDIDNDGLREFLDGWGKPIAFLRWAPGFVSEKQIADPVNNHDPLDVRLLHAQAYALVPLIYSAGPDGIFDINSGGYMGNNPFSDPTVGAMSDQPSEFGPANGEMNALDNIHNHLIGTR